MVLAAVKTGPQQTERRELPRPEVGAGSGLLLVEAAGVCGSDIPAYKQPGAEPLILGHENVGIVAALGAGAAARWGVREGDRVAVEEYLPCGHCGWCRQGEYRHCETTDVYANPLARRYGQHPLSAAPGLWGGFAQYLYLPPTAVLHRVPAGISPELLALALPLGNGVQWACIDAGVGPGSRLLIAGPGQQGLACLVAARASGAAQVLVSGLSRDGARLAVAAQLGASATIDVQREDLIERVRQLTDGQGVDAVVDCTSAHDGALVGNALAVLKRRGGTLVLQATGMPANFPLGLLGRKNVTLKPARGHSWAAVELGLQHLASGRYRLEQLATHRFGLADVDRALRVAGGELDDAAIHVTVDPRQVS